jgi:hypothetical protein
MLKEEHRLRVLENSVLTRIFGPKRNEVTGDWREMHNEELHKFYSSPNVISSPETALSLPSLSLALIGQFLCPDPSPIPI